MSAPVVICVVPVPLEFIATSANGNGPRVKAIFVPSGENAGASSSVEFDVSAV